LRCGGQPLALARAMIWWPFSVFQNEHGGFGFSVEILTGFFWFFS